MFPSNNDPVQQMLAYLQAMKQKGAAGSSPVAPPISGPNTGPLQNNTLAGVTPQAHMAPMPSSAPPAGAPGAPSAPISSPNGAPPAQSSGQTPSWMDPNTLFTAVPGGSFGGSNGIPMPKARPTPAPNPMNPNGTVAGAVGSTSVGGAPLKMPDGSAPVMQGPPAPSQGGGPQFNMSTGSWDYPSGTSNGSSLIQKMMSLLHGQANSGS